MNFNINCEEDLAQVWETLLLRFEFQKYIQDLSDFVRLIYKIGTLQLHHKYKFMLTMEEDDSYFYFSMNNMLLLNMDTLHKVINQSYETSVFQIKEDTLSFLLEKEPKASEYVDELLAQKEMITTTTSTVAVSHYEPEVIELKTYDILDDETMLEFDEAMKSLTLFVYLISTSTLHNDDIEDLCSALDSMTVLLRYSIECDDVSNVFKDFSTLFRDNVEVIIEKSESVSLFIAPFINDIVMWKEMVFYTGAPSINFLNDSFTSNIEMISRMLSPKEEQEEEDDLGDIFDF
jgi:hypothetical protein